MCSLNAIGQDKFDFKVIGKNQVAIVNADNNITSDTLQLTARNYGNSNYVKLSKLKNYAVRSQFIVPGAGSISSAYLLVEQWVPDQIGRLMLKRTVKLRLENCKLEKLKFEFSDNRLWWQSRTNIFKSKKGSIELVEKRKEAELNCNCS